MAVPPAEHGIDEPLVRALLRSQCSHLADEPLTFGAEGWDNAMVRIGDRFVARLPRRAVGDALVRHEQRWLPELAPRLPLAVPVPVVAGHPEHGYPWHWSICAWLPGSAADRSPPGVDSIEQLAAFLAALHRPAPHDAPQNPYRGVPLAARASAFTERLQRLDDARTRARLLRWFEGVAAAPDRQVASRWLHGDLHPANLLVDDGRLSAVVDFGDLCGGDPASDLAVAWMLWGPEGRDRFFRLLGTDAATIDRARGWAAALALAFLGDDGGRMTPIGRRTLDAVLAEVD